MSETIAINGRANKTKSAFRMEYSIGINIEAAAALAGYLRDINWQGKKDFIILQGEDMGMPSRLLVHYSSKVGESVSVNGEVRTISGA